MDNKTEEEILYTLKKILGRLDSYDNRLAALERRSEDVSEEFRLSSPALARTQPEDSEVILCLDFGTARSKAFATRGDDERLIDLAVGQRAGQATSPHSVLSCLFINEEGRIFFGEAAAARSEHAVAQGVRKRIESFKAMITNASPGSELRATALDAATNPSGVRLSEGDVLTLYLAYLTDMAGLELKERHGLSRYVRRRFTTPVFRTEHREWAADVLKQHYCEAILVADEFSGKWQTGIDAREALRVLKAAAARWKEVGYLTVDPLTEPIAAFASRYRYVEPQVVRRSLICIVDAGVGTTDFATFVVQEDPERGIKMFSVPGSVHALRKAGNEIDRILHEYIMHQVRQKHAGLGQEVLGRIRANLSLQQRQIKEDLFRLGSRDYVLSDDTRGTVTREEFLQHDGIKTFSTELQTEFKRALEGIHSSYLTDCAKGEIAIVMTGGSAHLPMIRDLGTLEFPLGAIGIRCRTGPSSIPRWVSENYPELQGEFLQLAVSIGGASRDIPQVASQEYAAFQGLIDQGPWKITPARKGL